MASNDGRIDLKWFGAVLVILALLVGYMWGTGQFATQSGASDEQEISNPISPEP